MSAEEVAAHVAEVLWSSKAPDGMRAAMRPDCYAMAEALDAAGLLASPEHDLAVALEALRDAADALEADAAGPGNGLGAHDAGIFHAALRLRERADRIEREGGAS